MADVIICLGSNFLRRENFIKNKARTRKAVGLYFRKKAKKIIFSGGYYSRKDISEARFMANLAIKKEVPEEDIILEEKSIETIENAKFTNQLMNKFGFKSAIIVTSDWHMKRTGFVFRKIMKNKKLKFIGTPDLGFFGTIIEYGREFFALRKVKKKFIPA